MGKPGYIDTKDLRADHPSDGGQGCARQNMDPPRLMARGKMIDQEDIQKSNDK